MNYTASQSNNFLLQSLSPEAFKTLEAKLTYIEHPCKTLIAEPSEQFKYVYFPDEWMVSIVLVSQTAACNRLHALDERCARWLLFAHDRDLTGTIELTQDFLSMMLGVRRSCVNIAIKTLEHSGLIVQTRGSISRS